MNALKKTLPLTCIVLLLGMLFGSTPAQAQTFAYVTNQSSNSVSIIATASNTVVATVAVGIGPVGVAITPDGAFAYVTNQGSNSVSVIATTSNTVVATVPVGNFPISVAITPNGAFAYVANFFSNDVSVIATASNTVVATVAGGSLPFGLAITPDGAFVYVANFNSNAISVIATASNTVVATVAMGSTPIGVAITPGPTNQPPDCSGAAIADQSADANGQVTISAADVTGVTDPDYPDAGNGWLTITVSPATLVLGANTVTVDADDGNGGMCSIDILVNVVDDWAFVAYDEPPTPKGGFWSLYDRRFSRAIQTALKYPENARKAGIEGVVNIQVLVSEKGEVIKTNIIESLGHTGCDQAAVNAIKKVKWNPAMQGDKPVRVWVAIPVIFRLKL